MGRFVERVANGHGGRRLIAVKVLEISGLAAAQTTKVLGRQGVGVWVCGRFGRGWGRSRLFRLVLGRHGLCLRAVSGVTEGTAEALYRSAGKPAGARQSGMNNSTSLATNNGPSQNDWCTTLDR